MRVRVVAYDPRWPDMFAEASAEIAACLGGELIEIHHIGSTSISGMHAKPVIDMLAVAADSGALDALSPRFEELRYEVMGEFGIPGRRYFRRNDLAGERTRQIHAFEVGSPHVARHLAFRDFMRTHAEEARQYAELKQRLAREHPEDIEAYMDGKDPFIKEMERRALEWAGRI